MFYQPQDWVKVAVQRLGGPTPTAVALGVSGTTIFNWLKLKRVSDIGKAKQLAHLSGLDLQQLRPTL